MALKRHRALVPGGTDTEINEDTPHTLQIPNCDPREETTGLPPPLVTSVILGNALAFHLAMRSDILGIGLVAEARNMYENMKENFLISPPPPILWILAFNNDSSRAPIFRVYHFFIL